MRKYIILCFAICIILLPLIVFYETYKPRVGPIGDGKVSPLYWITFSTTLFAGLCNLAYSILLFIRERE